MARSTGAKENQNLGWKRCECTEMDVEHPNWQLGRAKLYTVRPSDIPNTRTTSKTSSSWSRGASSVADIENHKWFRFSRRIKTPGRPEFNFIREFEEAQTCVGGIHLLPIAVFAVG